jgi:hypothetical protein
MSLPAIMTGLAARGAATPGVASAFRTAPNKLGALPCFVVMHDPERESTVTMGASEMWVHRLLPRLYIAPVKNIPNELEAAEAFVEPFVASIRAQYQLGVVGVYATDVTGYRIGTAEYGGTAYVVVEWPTEVKTKAGTEITV